MTRSLSLLIALLAAPALTACYEHPAPVPRDGGPPVDAPSDDAAPADARIDAHAEPPDAHVACATDDDCEATACEVAACVEGECVATPVDEGTACDDGDLCTESDVCAAGACSGVRRSCSACSEAGGGATLTTLAARWDKYPEAILARTDGSVTITGFADSDLWVASVGGDGEVIFDRHHGDASMGDVGYALARPLGAAGATGALVSGSSQIEGGHARPWVIEIDAAGDELASHVPFGDRGGSAHGLVALPDGDSIVLANVGGSATLARLSSSFEIEWETSYFEVGSADGLTDVAVLPDGDMVFAGGVGRFPTRSVQVVRVRPTGDVRWERSLAADSVSGIVARPDGTIVVVGQRLGVGSAWLAQIGAAGQVLSEHTYGADGNGSIRSVSPAPDGTLVLAAVDEGDAWILRVGADGALLEDARLDLGAYESADAIQVLTDGTVIVAGSSDLPGLEAPRHAWVARAASVSALACPE